MPPRAPEFWQRRGGWAALLAPLGWLYDAAGAARFALTKPYRANVPVICVGNLGSGGSGKTPIVISLARRFTARGIEVHLLSRGYGGSLKGPIRVDPARHSAAEVGDEPLLLAATAPCWVARDRAAGARAAEAAGAELILIDDGLQNPGLAKDLSLIAIDGGYGFGNGAVMPAGPLRESLARGLAHTDAAIILGSDETGVAASLAGKPVLLARPRVLGPALKSRTVVAFAGIGRPEKFFRNVEATGANLAASHAFPDHHAYSEAELQRLLAEARAVSAVLLTTDKDRVRLNPAWRARVEALPIDIAWDDEAALDRLLAPVLRAVRHG
ncbi:MAG TPA: tetraacyldisaccharide 4'-kinase [Stellaceae bacterium]|jgi:tetraacyldisaccharide 4'-kinase|nr:tetraacyldisaccharide 4'-kinase [Stellaceae bacterium]